jgi:heterokaryon incompatibility protein (HET)
VHAATLMYNSTSAVLLQLKAFSITRLLFRRIAYENMTSTTSSDYRYQILHDNEFRLLSITKLGATIHCSLHVHDINKKQEYYALSYCWGSEESSKSIVCNGQKLRVAEHLLTRLETISHHFSSLLFLIDTICINQQDDAEKSVQVPHMAEIFSTAEQIII